MRILGKLKAIDVNVFVYKVYTVFNYLLYRSSELCLSDLGSLNHNLRNKSNTLLSMYNNSQRLYVYKGTNLSHDLFSYAVSFNFRISKS